MLVAYFVLLLVVPMLMLLWVSLLPFFQPVSAAAFKLISLNNYRTVLASDDVWLMINTFLVAISTATIVATLTFLAAWLAVRRLPGGWLIERLATIPLVFPGLILGIVVMQLFLRACPPGLRHDLDSGVGLRHQLPALWHALRVLRDAADSPRAGGGGGDLRRRSAVAARADRGAVARAGADGGLVVHLPDVDARPLARDPARGPEFANHGGCDVQPLGQWPGHQLAALRLMWSMLMAVIYELVLRLGRSLGRRRVRARHRLAPRQSPWFAQRQLPLHCMPGALSLGRGW